MDIPLRSVFFFYYYSLLCYLLRTHYTRQISRKLSIPFDPNIIATFAHIIVFACALLIRIIYTNGSQNFFYSNLPKNFKIIFASSTIKSIKIEHR